MKTMMKGNRIMRKRLKICTIIACLTVIYVLQAQSAASEVYSSLKEAKMSASENDLPILLVIGVDWSKQSQMFDKKLKKNTEISSAVFDNAILCTVNADEEEGSETARLYHVRNYPAFVLTGADGDIIDQWYGFGCDECFIKRLNSSLEDPVTIKERITRFRYEPTEADALKLGEIRHAQGFFGEAVSYYRRAQELGPESEINYDSMIFGAMTYGNYDQLFSSLDVKKQADLVMLSGESKPEELLKLAFSMGKIAERAKDISLFEPYLKAAVERTAELDDKGLLGKRKHLLPEYALHIENDVEKALELKKEIQPEGWKKSADLLNNFAWWCFQKQINLEEAEKYARKALEMAQPGIQKANILDTLAEIVNSSGNHQEALEYIRLAVAEQPENDYFQNQEKRFESQLITKK